MKKLLLKTGFVVVAMCSGISLFISLKSDAVSGLMAANIEALTQNEELTGGESGSEFESPNGFPFTVTCNVAISDKRRCKSSVITCQGGGSGCNPRPCPAHH